jgi:SAM-dependent methyltransferase
MENQLELIANAYDKAIDLGRKGISLDLPEYITDDPDYNFFQKSLKEIDPDSSSGHKDIKDYLSPDKKMKFIDLGCCLNLMFRGYDKWPSTYYAVDISNKTIQLLNEFVANNKLSIGSLYCGSIHETPFNTDFFDIGACIGVLEYFEKDFVSKALIEIHRIMKRNGKFILDIPDNESKLNRLMILIEEYFGRPHRFDILPHEFEEILKNYFEVEKKVIFEDGPMILYYLRCKK